MTVFSIFTLQKFTNFHAIRSWNFHNICNEIGWPRFLRHPVAVACIIRQYSLYRGVTTEVQKMMMMMVMMMVMVSDDQ